MKKHSLEYVKDYFSKNNCLFLDDDYINNSFLHNYICKCGNKSKICFNHFKHGKRCKQCAGNKKYNLEFIKKYFEDNGCIFLDDDYKNANYPHNYQCVCGNKSKTRLIHFRSGKRCEFCKKIKTRERQITPLQVVKESFLKNNCEFLDDFYNGKDFPHNYKCSCGSISKIRFNHFKKGGRCQNCAISGFKSSKESFVYLVGNHYKQKIGIMNTHTNRLKKHMKDFGMNLIDKIHFIDGEDAIELENKILDILKQKNIPHGKQVFKENFNGITESWLIKDLEVKSINELINL